MDLIMNRSLKYSSMIVILFVLALSCYAQSTTTSKPNHEEDKILACYYRTKRINENMLPANVCTHILFAFGVVTPNGIETELESDIAAYRTLVRLKEQNPKLKIMISLQNGFPSVVDSGTEAMLRFSLAALTFLQTHGLDGVDFDWEFPDEDQKEPYAELIMIMSTVLHWSGKQMSMAGTNSRDAFDWGYIIDTLNTHLDFMTVMTYDFHFYADRPYGKTTGFNSPLYSSNGDHQYRSASGMVDFYISRGVSPSKLLIGFPTYARSFELTNSSDNGIHAPIVGMGAPGPVTDMRGYYLIQDICVASQQGGTIVTSEEAGAEYMYHGSTWISFNGNYSVDVMTAWLKTRNIRGVGVWTFEMDDPNNVCGMGPFPMLTKIRSLL